MLRRHRLVPALALALVVVSSALTAGANAHDPIPGPVRDAALLVRGPANPILRNDNPEDEIKTGPSTIVKVAEGDYRQWYEAVDAENSPGAPDFLTQAAFATSTDGTTWTKKGVVLSPLPAPSWERSEVSPTSMHWDGSQWVLFYHGGNNLGPRAIGRATSQTGIGDFTRYPANPILERGSAGSWDSAFVADAKVIPPWEGPDELWRMYYVGRSAADVGQVGLATSTDGVSFEKAAANPVVSVGSPGAWDDGTIQAFTAEWDAQAGLFRAWYVAGAGRSGGNAGYLWSPDGVDWTASPLNPVLTSIPGDHVQDSIDAYRDGNRYRIVYGQYDLGASPPLRGKGEASMLLEVSPVPAPPTPPPPVAPHTTAAFQVAVGADDGDLERGDASYPPSGQTETGGSTLDSTIMVRRSKTTADYQPVSVALLRFDTSLIPSDATITYAELQLHVVDRTAIDQRDLLAEWHPAAAWPIDAQDWTADDSNSAHVGTPLSALAPGTQVSLRLDNTSAIDPNGMSALRLHVSGGAAPPTGLNDVRLASLEHPTLPAPTLVVTYRVGG